MAFNIRLRGIRKHIPVGTVLASDGKGGAAPVLLTDLQAQMVATAGAASGQGQGGNALPSPGSNGQVLAVVSGSWASTFTTLITGLGTIATGIWQGTKIALTYGGTGSDMHATGPGVVVHATSGANFTDDAQLRLAFGGTGSDLSGTGAASNVLKQVSSGAAVTVGQLGFTDLRGKIANAQIDSTIDYTNITGVGTITAGTWNGGVIAVTYGGTGANLSATGGAHQVLKQSSSGAAVTVGQLDFSDLASTLSTHLVAGTNITLSGTDPVTINATSGSDTDSYAALTDVSLSSLNTYDVPRYDVGAGKWYNIGLSALIDSLGHW